MRKPPEPAARVWSWWHDRWWPVDAGASLAEMVASAAARQAFVTQPLVAPTPVRKHGAIVLNPAGRFVATARGQHPGDVIE